MNNKKTSNDIWVVGESIESGTEYLIHLQTPKFISTVGFEDETLTGVQGLTYELESGEILHNFIWIDGKAPSSEALKTLMDSATEALTSFAEEKELEIEEQDEEDDDDDRDELEEEER